MGFAYELYENGHILAIHSDEYLTIEDIQDMDVLIRNHCRRMQSSVHIVFDLMMVEDYPRNVLELQHELHWTREENLDWVIFISNNHYLNVMLDTAMHLSGHSYLMLDDFDAAMNIVYSEYEMAS